MTTRAVPAWGFQGNSGLGGGASILEQLQAAHRELEACIDEMDAVTRAPQPDRYHSARLRISQASLARRKLFCAICGLLETAPRRGDAQALGALRQDDQEMSQRSARHVSRWSSAEIAADWNGYCAASKDIRRRMLIHIRREKAVLYPILWRRAR